MKRLSLLGLELDIRARRKGEQPLSLDDLRELNDETIRYVRSLTESELSSRVSEVTVASIADVSAINATLETHGIVIVPDFIKEESVSAIAGAINSLQSMIEDFARSSEAFREQENYLLQKGACKVSGYDSLTEYGKPVIQIRDGQDSGMVDVFNIDHLFQDFRDIIRPAYEQSPISHILGATSHQLRAKNLNLYVNSGITRTRGFHVDAYRKKLKSFIYLSDVLSLDDGPYTYVKGSHVDSAYRRINQTLSRHLPNRTETPVVSLDSIIPAIARKGTLVISDQGGSHRGFPQQPGHARMVSVMNYS